MFNVFVAYVCRVRRIVSVSSTYSKHVAYYAAVARINTAPISHYIIPADVIKQVTCLPRRSKQPGAEAEEEEKARRPRQIMKK